MNIPDDPFIVELLPEFVDTWIQDIEVQYQQLINSHNADELYRFGHTLKGSCFQFGLDEVAELGIELMGYAKEQDWSKAANLESPIKESFIQVKKFLQVNEG